VFRMSRASLLARLPLYCSAECATPTNTSLFENLPRMIPHLLCLRNARAFPLLPAALASVPFGFVLVRVRVQSVLHYCNQAHMHTCTHVSTCSLFSSYQISQRYLNFTSTTPTNKHHAFFFQNTSRGLGDSSL